MKNIKLLYVLGITLCILSFLPSTYSYYTKTFSGGGTVRAASTNEIIESFEITDDSPPVIKIKKASDAGYAPRVYFSVEGEASTYVLNINPITLNDDSIYYTIPLNINISFSQFIYLLNNPDINSISGKVKISYLNGYISIEKDFKLDREYLVDSYKKALNLTVQSENKNELLSKTMLYTASQGCWDNVFNDSTNQVQLDENQNEIIDKVTPGLFEYINFLQSEIEIKNREVDSSHSQIDDLNLEITNLKAEIDALHEEKSLNENPPEEIQVDSQND